MHIHSENAKIEAEQKLKEIMEMLEDISAGLGMYSSLLEYDYGHVGDLNYISDKLAEVHEFMFEKEI